MLVEWLQGVCAGSLVLHMCHKAPLCQWETAGLAFAFKGQNQLPQHTDMIDFPGQTRGGGRGWEKSKIKVGRGITEWEVDPNLNLQATLHVLLGLHPP